MPKVTYVAQDGSREEIDAGDGKSVMKTATGNGVDGIIGECGGNLMCATCHVYVDDDWIETTGTRSEEEDELLEFSVAEVRPNSRLSCQIEMSAELDGLVVHLPKSQV